MVEPNSILDRINTTLQAISIFLFPMLFSILLLKESVVGGLTIFVGGFFWSRQVYKTWDKGVKK